MAISPEEVWVHAPTDLLLIAVPPREEDPLLTPSDLAAREGVCVATVRSWRRHGCPVVWRGESYLFRNAEFRAWAAEHLVRGANGSLRYRRGTRPTSRARMIISPMPTEFAVAPTIQQGSEGPPECTLLRLPPYPQTMLQFGDADNIAITTSLHAVLAQLPKAPPKRDKTTAEIAARFRVSPKTVVSWRAPDCPADFVGRGYLWNEDEVGKALCARRETRREVQN